MTHCLSPRHPLCLFCQVGDDKVHTALSLVGYEPELRKAMEYVFGTTLVCDTLDNARKVAFDKRVMTKTVTLGGDIVNPQGTLTGGEHKEDVCAIVSSRENKTIVKMVLDPKRHSLMHPLIMRIFRFSFPFSGARSQSVPVLSLLQEVKDVQDNLNEKEAQLKDVERQLASLKGTAEKYEHQTPA